MGKFISNVGADSISNDIKKKEFIANAMKVLDEGGMMDVEPLALLNKKITTLIPLRANEKNRVVFCYNYYEDDWWEDASLNVETGEVISNKVGSLQFSDVMRAVYVLKERYTDGYCFTYGDGSITDEKEETAWLNHVLGKTWTTQEHISPWKMYEITNQNKYLEFDIDDLDGLLLVSGEKGRREGIAVWYCLDRDNLMASVSEDKKEADNETGNQDDNDPKISITKYTQTCIKTIEQNVVEFMMENGNNKRSFDRLIQAIVSGSDSDEENEKVKELLSAAKVIGPQIPIKFASDIYDEDFWYVWSQVKDRVSAEPHDLPSQNTEEVVFTLGEMCENPDNSIQESNKQVCNIQKYNTMKTAEFLNLSGWMFLFPLGSKFKLPITEDDRIYWWRSEGGTEGNTEGSDEKNGVELSQEAKIWLKNLAVEYNVILSDIRTGNIELLPKMDFIEKMFDLMKEADDNYCRIYPFNDQILEFVIEAENEKYQALMILFGRLIVDNKEEKVRIVRPKIKRFVALMANKELRKEVFGF